MPSTNTPGRLRGDAPVIVAALRSAIGTTGRSFVDVEAADLAAPVISAATDAVGDLVGDAVAAVRAGTTGPTIGKADDVLGEVRDVVLGNCTGPGGNLARVAALTAGLPATVPGLTVDRQCGSGLAAVAVAASMLREEPGLVLAGGVESASTAPWRFWPPQGDEAPVRYHRAPFAPRSLGDPEMGLAADLLAAEAGVSRQRQDEYAARSHALAVAAQRDGSFEAEIVPVRGVARDDRPREGMCTERLARLRPAFREDGTVTAGNSCGVNDGAAVLALIDAETHRRLGLPGLRVLATATAGVDPNRPGLGIVPAVERALDLARVDLSDIDRVELNEAFAGQVLACCDALHLGPKRVCAQGGAIALGHPWGASGAVLLVRLFTQLVRQDAGELGLAAIAVGGGQGVAMVVQRCR